MLRNDLLWILKPLAAANQNVSPIFVTAAFEDMLVLWKSNIMGLTIFCIFRDYLVK